MKANLASTDLCSQFRFSQTFNPLFNHFFPHLHSSFDSYSFPFRPCGVPPFVSQWFPFNIYSFFKRHPTRSHTPFWCIWETNVFSSLTQFFVSLKGIPTQSIYCALSNFWELAISSLPHAKLIRIHKRQPLQSKMNSFLVSLFAASCKSTRRPNGINNSICAQREIEIDSFSSEVVQWSQFIWGHKQRRHHMIPMRFSFIRYQDLGLVRIKCWLVWNK